MPIMMLLGMKVCAEAPRVCGLDASSVTTPEHSLPLRCLPSGDCQGKPFCQQGLLPPQIWLPALMHRGSSSDCGRITLQGL